MKKINLALFLLVISGLFISAQVREIKGKVTSGETGNPISGVKVSVKNTSNHTLTDNYGKYSILAGAKDILVFNFAGYKKTETEVGIRKIINVVLKSEIDFLAVEESEVMVDKVGIRKLELGMESLTPEQQICIKLFYLEKRSYVEISSQTGFELKKVKSNIQNGKRNLKLFMEKHGE